MAAMPMPLGGREEAERTPGPGKFKRITTGGGGGAPEKDCDDSQGQDMNRRRDGVLLSHELLLGQPIRGPSWCIAWVNVAGTWTTRWLGHNH